METKYNPKEIEARWYQYWQDNKLFHSEPDSRDPFTIVIPPPNVTGVLHMGHVLNETKSSASSASKTCVSTPKPPTMPLGWLLMWALPATTTRKLL